MANEKRLIWLYDALTVSTPDRIFDHSKGEIVLLATVCEKLRNLPTVDAVEVVHGRWEDEHSGKYANPRYRCSVCKEKALYRFERDMLGNYKEVQELTPNCPYCTAKLDGGADNDI